ncbi:MAG: hypothetical protein LDL47_00825 [Cyanobacteria bacterium KgW148]|nr:hypothetical protein [Cyanobacteria bacterium KgW148]
MKQATIDLILGMVQMEIEHLNAQINANAVKFRIQFEGICASLEALKQTKVDLDAIFVKTSEGILLDFDRLQFFSKSDGMAELLTNPLLDTETIEEFRWKFLYYETKLEALSLEVQKLQNRSLKRGIQLDELIRNWLHPPDRILAEYRELLQSKRLLREQIREELLQNSNLAKKYVSGGLKQIQQFFRGIEQTLPQNQQLQWQKRESQPYDLLAELKLLHKDEYLFFYCTYSLHRSFQLNATLEDNWHYSKAKENNAVYLESVITWIAELLDIYETETNLVAAKVVAYDKLTDRERVYNIP